MANKRHTFVVNDDNAINSYGFRVLTAGIKLTQFKKNPIVLWMHKRPSRWEGNDEKERFPIGLAYNLRKDPKDSARLLADIEFDESDEFAQKIAQKVESGHLRMCSAGLAAIATSDDTKQMFPGQTRATLTKSELIEISIVDIGANPNAIKLYDGEMNVVNLSADGGADIIPFAKPSNSQNQTNSKMDKFQEQVAVLLGLNPEASTENTMKVLREQLQLATKADEYKLNLDTLQEKYDTLANAEVVSLVNANVDKKFKAEDMEFYLNMGKKNGYETVKGVIDRMPDISGRPADRIDLSRNPQGGSGGQELEDPKTWDELRERGMDAVKLCRKQQPQLYINLYKAHYNSVPDMD